MSEISISNGFIEEYANHLFIYSHIVAPLSHPAPIDDRHQLKVGLDKFVFISQAHQVNTQHNITCTPTHVAMMIMWTEIKYNKQTRTPINEMWRFRNDFTSLKTRGSTAGVLLLLLPTEVYAGRTTAIRSEKNSSSSPASNTQEQPNRRSDLLCGNC